MKHKKTLEKVKIILDEYEELSCKAIQSLLIERGTTNVPSTNRLGQIMRGRFIRKEAGRKQFTWRNKQ
jgi:hypothetical protein